MKKVLYLLLVVLSLAVLAGCGDENGENNPEDIVTLPTEVPSQVDLSKIKLENVTFEYDGNQHSIEVSNLPSGYTVSYIGNDVATIGTHTVMAFISNEKNEIVLTLTATITIVETGSIPTVPPTPTQPSDNLDDVEFVNKTFIYDGKEKSITVLNLPQGYEVSYQGNGVSEVGKHLVTATITKDGVEVLILQAYITITQQSDVELPLV